MAQLTEIICSVENGDFLACEQLLPLVCDELRTLAAARLAHERRGLTLQPTALVHEAYLWLVGGDSAPDWESPPKEVND